ncbi:MAG: ABC transporter substrate-binding protein [Halomonas sp.]|uniref:ABC transporter substrate-binding protein n=1 Tax=Halomonas sp. TaxID=1486246 RepID=UPI003F8EF4CE
MRYLTLLLALLITPLTGLAGSLNISGDLLTIDASDTQPQSTLVIHGALDMEHITPILVAFHQRHPHINITYRNLGTLALHQRFLDAPDEVDVLISSAMPWQYRLANDGHAHPLDSPVSEAWPAQARWRHELFAFTFEPVVLVVHRELIQHYGRPSGHTELLNLLETHGTALRGRVVTYDPATSGAGYSYAIQEAGLSPRYWDLVAAFGKADAQLVSTTSAMLEGLQDGRFWIGYNLLGSYAQPIVDASPELEMIIPEDYVLVTQRTALISQHAPNPNTAHTFMGFLLSQAGQQVIAGQTSLGALHPGLTGKGSAAELRRLRGDALRPLALTPALLATLDDLKRRALLQRWQREFSPLAPQTPHEPAARPAP